MTTRRLLLPTLLAIVGAVPIAVHAQGALAVAVPPVGVKPPSAAREPQTAEEAVKVSAVVVGQATPGATVRIAVTFDIVPGWHIYWENPGESGSPTMVEVEFPRLELPGVESPGAQGGGAACTVATRADGKPAVDFPVPSVFSHGETTFGYEKSVTLSVEVKLPQTMPAAGLPAKVRTRWLVCKERCLMGSAETAVDLAKPVAADAAPARALADSLARLPKPLPAGWKLTVADAAAETATLVVEAPADTPADAAWRFIPNDTPGCLLESGYLADAKGRLLRVPLMLSRESTGGRPLEVAGLLVLGKNGPAYAFRMPIPAP